MDAEVFVYAGEIRYIRFHYLRNMARSWVYVLNGIPCAYQVDAERDLWLIRSCLAMLLMLDEVCLGLIPPSRQFHVNPRVSLNVCHCIILEESSL
jgi:hypothetical protein